MFDGSVPGPGRPLGSKNKKRVPKELLDLLDANNYDPVTEMVRLSREPDCPHLVRARIGEMILRMMYPMQKSVQHSGHVEHSSVQISLAVQEPLHTIEAETVVPQTLDNKKPPETVSRAADDASEDPTGT